MARVRGENVERTDAWKNVKGKFILNKKAGTTVYKVAGQCTDWPCGEGGQGLGRKSTG